MANGVDSFQLTGFARDPKVLTGAAHRWARRNAVSPAVVRACLIALSLVAGIGVVLYWFMWRRIVVNPPQSTATTPGSTEPHRTRELTRRSVGLVLLTVAVLQIGDTAGLSVGGLQWAVFFGSLGCLIAWDVTIGESEVRSAGMRLLLGGALGVVGVMMLMSTIVPLSDIIDSLFIGGAFTLAVGLILGPKLWELATTAIDERQERIRSEEREAVAAHLHDSVLQTLTLIQRHANDPNAHPRTVASLARRQERDLRRWLYGRSMTWEPGARLRDTFEALTAEIEDLYGVSIEPVIVGDTEMRTEWQPLIGASREALTNAAKFAGDQPISLFVEIQRHDNHSTDMTTPERPDAQTAPGIESVQVFVRDRGTGFQLDSIPLDRHGIRDSIIGRLERSGGSVSIRSTPVTGTEVELQLKNPIPAATVGQGTA